MNPAKAATNVIVMVFPDGTTERTFEETSTPVAVMTELTKGEDRSVHPKTIDAVVATLSPKMRND